MGQIAGRTCVNYVIEESNKTRSLLSDSTGAIGGAGVMTGRGGGLTMGKAGGKSHKSEKLHRRPAGGGSMKIRSQMYESHLKENGELIRPSDSAPKKDVKEGEIDLKILQQKRQHAEIQRNRIEEEIRENHPYFDRPLFMVGRNSRFRRFCQTLVYAKYEPTKIDAVTGKLIQRSFKELHELLGLMTYLDWTMVLITQLSCVSMLFESSWPLDEVRDGEKIIRPQLIQNNYYLRASSFSHSPHLPQISDYLFVAAMTVELILKVLANGLFFTPKAVVRDLGGVMTAFIYVVSGALSLQLQCRLH